MTGLRFGLGLWNLWLESVWADLLQRLCVQKSGFYEAGLVGTGAWLSYDHLPGSEGSIQVMYHQP